VKSQKRRHRLLPITRLLTLSSLLISLSACRSAPAKRPNANVEAPQFKQHNQRSRIVCLDPRVIPLRLIAGATVQNGTTEVHIAWLVALKIQNILQAEAFGWC